MSMSECAKNILGRGVKIAIFIVIGSIISLLSYWVHSTFLSQLYGVTLISMILACTALSFAMYSFIANKLIEIKQRYPKKFQKTNHELYVALKTQLVLLGTLFIVLICYHSPIITSCWIFSTLILEILINAIVICFIYIIYDMGRTTYYIIVNFDMIMSLEDRDKITKKD